MTPIELKARREALGFNQSDLARHLGINQVSLSHWETGKRPIPERLSGELNVLEDQVEDWLLIAAEMLDATSTRPVELTVWPSDEAFWNAHPEFRGLPAVLYRVAMARARMEADDPNSTFLVGP